MPIRKRIFLTDGYVWKKDFFVCCSALFELQQYENQVPAKYLREGWVYIGNRLKVCGCGEECKVIGKLVCVPGPTAGFASSDTGNEFVF